jgi:glycosyl transferase-like sugar-binding protein
VIPPRLVRTVPEHTTAQVEQWWDQACALHPHWEHVTLRDPIAREHFPLTARYWDRCESGAQMADLIRLEELWWRGGVYIDSDVEVYRSFEPLRRLTAFAGYDCVDYVPNAIMGFEPTHQALDEAIHKALALQSAGTWAAGVGVTTEVFPAHDDVVLFPPGSFYPVFWRLKDSVDWSRVQADNPWAYCAHHAHHSWAGVVK